MSADVLATYRVDTLPGSTDPNRPWRRHTISLTDRRSGAVLGEMIHVLDGEDWGRACGANTDTAISELAFFYDAINR